MEEINNKINTISQPNSEFKKPVKVYRLGTVQASIWENKTKEGKTFLSVTLKKSWKDEESGVWKNGMSYSKQDLGNLFILINNCAQYLMGVHK